VLATECRPIEGNVGAPEMTVFTESAPAKINLTLEVLGKRTDGYHELKSLVAFAREAADAVTLDTSLPVGSSVSGPFGATIAGQNLIDVTLAKLAAAAPGLRLGHVHLTKNLPIAAGIGGGSADAAAVIRAVQKANPEHVANVDWKRIALSIGADVPVCIVSQLAWMRGIGEIVAPLKFAEPVWVDAIIINPLVAVPEDKTAQVFRAYADRPNPDSDRPENHPSIRGREDLLNVIRRGWNDLQLPAWQTMPASQEVFQSLGGVMKPGCRGTRMSGAGPTYFAIFEDAANAASAAAMLQRQHPNWWVRAVALG
jgi:4-diphosphocytidyl-2-C-methyl-D-erythritol kinase